MFWNKGVPYSLRKYKRIFRNEMEKRPQLYGVLDADGNEKDQIDGIRTHIDDERFDHNIPDEDPSKRPADFDE